LTAWDDLIPDGRLRGAAIVAYTYNDEFRQLAKGAVRRRTRIVWGDLPPDLAGEYDRSREVITISNSLRPESTAVLAAVLAHEIVHVNQQPSASAADCLENEGHAFAWQ